MDKLEKFISENREKLDLYEPSPTVWEGVVSSSHPKQKTYLRILARVAVITLLLSTSLVVYISTGGGRSDSVNSAIQSGRDINPEFRETELYYSNKLNSLLVEAKPILTNYPQLEEELYNDLSRLDSLSKEIKRDLKDNVSNQNVIEALIVNYRIKIQILEDMLMILNEDNILTEDNNVENEIL